MEKKQKKIAKTQLERERLFLEILLSESNLKQTNLQLRAERFSKKYHDTAWKLEKIRSRKEPCPCYIR
jgi:hypothetical protein